MGDDDKPFACNMTGCTMKFANEDHLTVHKKKHEMSLSLNSPSILKDNYVDQTPTPTKLLRNCLEVGLFQDLGLQPNPFDEQFRKATQSGTPTASSSSTCVLDQDSLNTPSVPLLTSDVHLPVPSADILETSCNIPRPSFILPDPEPEAEEETMPFDPSSNSCEPSTVGQDVVDDYDLVETESQTVPAVIVRTAKAATLAQANVRSAIPKRVVQTPVITSVASLKPKMAAPAKQQIVLVSRSVASTTSSQPVITLTTPATQTAKVIQSAQTAASSVVSTTTSNPTMIQLIVKLDGQSMPFNIPLPSTMTSVPAATTVVTNPNTVTVQPSRIVTASARDALKGTMEAKMSRKGAPTVVNAISSSSSQATLLGSKLPTTIGSINSNNPVATVQPTVRNTYNTGKRREQEDDDPQEKRRKFLERNRAAATRCRLKKKKWVDDLENKCKELTAQNLQLQKEVSNLRNEVAHLKTLLLAHKDCPITQQQMKTNGQQQVYSLSTLTTVCASSGSSPSVTSFRTVDSNSSPVLLETIHLEGSEGSMDNSNDDSVPESAEY